MNEKPTTIRDQAKKIVELVKKSGGDLKRPVPGTQSQKTSGEIKRG
jgi:ribosomal protein S10